MSDQPERKRSSTYLDSLKDDACPSPDSKKHKGAFSEATNKTEKGHDNGTPTVPSSNGVQEMSGRHLANGTGSDGAEHVEIDESLYSRQLYVLGHETMQQMAKSNILISGMGGVGAEVAKNIILGGVRSVILHDKQKTTFADLSSQFYLTESDIGRNRAEASVSRFAELNSYVHVEHSACDLTPEYLSKFQAVVLCSYLDFDDILSMSDYCHEHNIKFILACTRGLFGQLFCDFGSSFIVTDPDGEEPVSAVVESITKDKDGIVTLTDNGTIGFSVGDLVSFTHIRGATELNSCGPLEVKSVINPFVFSIGDTTRFGEYQSGGVATQVKRPVKLAFKSLRQSLDSPEYLISDFAKIDREPVLHQAFRCYGPFVKSMGGQPPKPRNVATAKKFVEFCKTAFNVDAQTLDEAILEEFASQAVGDVCPMNAVIGGIAAQEAIKSISGKFTPVQQWMYFDALECLPTDKSCLTEATCEPRGCRYDSEIAVFGQDYIKKLASLKLFLVGAGAIGCEMLKNWAMMGVGCSKMGNVVITDMDLIERSNLNRQFLFRRGDLQQPKSDVAALASRKMNPAFHIEAHRNRVGPETEELYNDGFFMGLDLVVNALDNVDARQYMDRRCVYYRKPLLESGTLGTKGNVQVVYPDMTESYSSSQDPPEKSFPICTIKNFPNAIEHTLHWAREAFDTSFCAPMFYVVQYLADADFIQKTLKNNAAQAIEILATIKRVLIDERPKSFEDCVAWARLQWQEDFYNQIEQMLFNFPPDAKTTEGQPFWSGAKRCPHSLKFDKSNSRHIDYVFAGANLRASMFGLPQNRDRNAVLDMISRVKVPVFKPKEGVRIAVTDQEHESMSQTQQQSSDEQTIHELIASIPSRESLVKVDFEPIEFEKDDDNNLHMDFIVAASNSRAENYDIPQADRHKSKLIAGRIIPAIATTTSLVVGLVCLELFKVVQGHKDIEKYKNGFLNIALPFFAFSEPVAPKKATYNGNDWTLWDRFVIEGEPTLGELIDKFTNEHGLEITMLSAGVAMLFAFFMPKDKQRERRGMKITQLVETVTGKPLPSWQRAIVLEICCNDKDGEDVEVPFIQYMLQK